jgi:Ras-related protein Rab-6A
MNRNKTNSETEELKYKLIVIGDELVGKTSILKRFKFNQFNAIYEPTVGLEFESIPILIDDQSVNLLLYDMSGHQKFRGLIPLYTSDANIILLIYDISKLDSFNNIEKWYSSLNNLNRKEVIFALVGNKCDLDYNRKVQMEQAQKYADDHNFIFQEVSAMNGDGIQELFMNKLIEQIRTQFIQKGKFNIDEEEEKLKVNINNNNNITTKKKKRCCPCFQ